MKINMWCTGMWTGFCVVLLACSSARAEEKVLFDFENEADAKAWANVDIYALREAETKAGIAAVAKAASNPATVPVYRPQTPPPAAEPEVKLHLTSDGATSGKQAMKLTFAGGRMPTISTTSPLDDWRGYKGFAADVTAGRTCIVVFRAMAKTSKYGVSYNDGVSRWEFAARLEAGKNHVIAPRPEYAATLWNGVHTVQIYMYNPREGETITVDNICLLTEKPKATSPFNDALPVPAGKYKALGTDLEVKDVNELAEKLKGQWIKPEDKTVEQVEAGIQADYEKIKKDHPKAVLVMLRDGQEGYDLANPDKVFAGWEDAGTPSHLPTSLTLACFANAGKNEEIETCFRNRPGFLRVDLSSIPRNSNVLAARLVVARGLDMGKNWETKPTMFVAEPCNRPWKEHEINVFEYAHDRFWKEYAGATWGEDGDCSAVFLAHGPSGGKTCSWDFTQAVKYWLDGQHANEGFILYGSPNYVDYLHICTRENKVVKNRPGLAVIYEPAN